MGARHADRLWMIGGAAITVALALISYFFLINPKYAEAADVRRQSEDTEVQISVLNKRIAELEKQKSKLPQYRAALKVSQRALPADSGVPDLLVQLQQSGDDLGVEVSGVTVNGAVAQKDQPSLYAVPITLTLEGTADNLLRFLSQLQTSQPRAVLINSTSMTTQVSDSGADSEGGSASSADKVTVSLSLSAFVAVPAGQGAPSITTTTK